MKRISIVIVTYNSEKDIYECVSSIKRYADIPLEEIELVIVDNKSTQGYEDMFERLRREWGEDIVLIENTHNGGYGQGNNVGIRHSTAPVILIMNPDVRMLMPCLKVPVEHFEKDSHLVMYGMKQMQTENRPSTYSFSGTTMMNGYMRTILTSVCNKWNLYIPSLMYFQGSCFFVRKEMFEKVGLYDESVFMYGEECDIHYRLKKAFGANFYFNKKLKYLHPTHQRPFTVEHELMLLDIDLKHHANKGYSRRKTLRNYIRKCRLNLVRQKCYQLVGKANCEYMDSLRKLIDITTCKLKEEL